MSLLTAQKAKKGTIMQTVDNFRQSVYDLDEIGRAKGLPTQFDRVYEAHKWELDKEHYG